MVIRPMAQLNTARTKLKLGKNVEREMLREKNMNLWNLANSFGSRTSIHGMNRLLGQSSGRYERILWFIAIVLAILGTIYVCLILSQRFTAGRFETVIDSTTKRVYEIDFPTVTICNENRLNWNRLDDAKDHFLPYEKSDEKLILFERFIAKYDDLRYDGFADFTSFENVSLHLINDVNFTNVVEFMSWRCEEVLYNCYWRGRRYHCCDIFVQQKSELGFCFAFNAMQSEVGRSKQLKDSFWPWRTSSYGPNSGLKGRIYLFPDYHYPHGKERKGIVIMANEPEAWSKEYFHVPANTETQMEIDPILFFYGKDTKRISSQLRKCVFDVSSEKVFAFLPKYYYCSFYEVNPVIIK